MSDMLITPPRYRNSRTKSSGILYEEETGRAPSANLCRCTPREQTCWTGDPYVVLSNAETLLAQSCSQKTML